MSYDEQFESLLGALAKLCNFELNETIAVIYDKALCGFGYAVVCKALQEIIVNRSNRDPFPSVKGIIDLIRPSANPQDEAVEAAARIIQAVNRFGYVNASAARDFIGELGWRVVQRFGGWQNVCETLTVENIGTLQAQFRQIANAQVNRAKMDLDDIAPVIQIKKRESDLLPASKTLSTLFEPPEPRT